MNIVAPQVGIDVAKLGLVVCIDQDKPFSIENKEQAVQELASKLPKGSIVQLEASGGFERLVRRVLHEAGFEVRTLNPLNCRRLAQAQGVRAKTDPVDAKGLAKSGSLVPSGLTKSLERQGLSDISRAIEAFKKTAVEYKLRMQLSELDELARKGYERLLATLKKEIVVLESEFVQRIKVSSYAGQYKLALSTPGIGPVSARIIVCELPEDFAQRRVAEIASYAGVAPINDDSGKRNGPAHVGRGNMRLKKALYMPALAAVRRQEWAKDHYARLRAKGKGHQLAIIAVMRRLLLRVVLVIQRGSPWEDKPAKT